ncbi:hypothetical protein DFS34DRAFT_683823 [Phlyctochytrium arcticum]|nr:hypothetical protein DFS34DRAFT_683823 [Phlyctochytrium arcticum]
MQYPKKPNINMGNPTNNQKTAAEAKEHVLYVWCLVNTVCYKMGFLSKKHIKETREVMKDLSWDIFEMDDETTKELLEHFKDDAEMFDVLKQKRKEKGQFGFMRWLEKEIHTYGLVVMKRLQELQENDVYDTDLANLNEFLYILMTVGKSRSAAWNIELWKLDTL